MGDLLYISSEQGGLIIRTELIYELPHRRPQELMSHPKGGEGASNCVEMALAKVLAVL